LRRLSGKVGGVQGVGKASLGRSEEHEVGVKPEREQNVPRSVGNRKVARRVDTASLSIMKMPWDSIK
jgi:hypothetical protein